MNKLTYAMLPLAVLIIIMLLHVLQPLPTETGSAGGGINEWLDIENPNNLDVLFQGQSITFSLINKSANGICISQYEPWSPLYEMVFRDNMCYDLDKGVAGPCSNESDIKITNNSIEFINNATITEFITSYTFFDNSALPSGSDHFKYTKILGSTLYGFTEDYPINLYMNTVNNSIKLRIALNHDKIIYGTEQHPQEWTCYDSGSVSISSDSLSEGENTLAFKTPGGEYTSYSVSKTDQPYTELYNPNLKDLIFPQEEKNSMNMTLYDYIIIRAEYNDSMDRIWFRCDDGPWEPRPANGRYAETFITSDFCRGDGIHNISLMVEYQGTNTSTKTYGLLTNTKRPSAYISLRFDANNGYVHLHTEYHSPNDIERMPEPISPLVWYKNNQPIENARSNPLDLSLVPVKDGDEIRAAYHPIDFTGLEGEPVNSETIKITDLPPFARGIVTNPKILYPGSQVSAKGIYFGLSIEGESEYRWYVNGKLFGEGSQTKLSGLEEGDFLKIEYTPIDSSGRTGSPASKTMQITVDDNYYIAMAVDNYNTSFCEGIEGSKEASLCREGVETGSQECGGRPINEKMFCLAFLTKNMQYCNYIDLDWYRSNCLALIGGNPEECMLLGEAGRDSCILEFASSTGKNELCTNITEPDIRILCNALAEKNPDACHQIIDPSIMERCISDASYN